MTSFPHLPVCPWKHQATTSQSTYSKSKGPSFLSPILNLSFQSVAHQPVSHSFIIKSFLQLVRSISTMHLTSLGLISIASFFSLSFFFFWRTGTYFPVPPAVEVQSLNHWTAREVPNLLLMRVQKAGSSLLEKTQDPA